MKTSSFLCILLGLAALKFSVLSGRAAPAAKSKAAVSAPTNAVPKSVFTMPESKKEGCDPFFPNSTRLWGISVAAQPVVKENKPSGADCLSLKGLSGAPSNPLAMINGRTMAKGEDAEVTTDCGRLLVHCVDITTNSAIIEVGGERRELRLRSDF
ncbi:MAG TPA: hypothetical protein VN761_02245 [Candidatus Polarisedimenticolia bacterium]|nr:hypothetical protein [Candidatus Polarisedimenticolia bacterium]